MRSAHPHEAIIRDATPPNGRPRPRLDEVEAIARDPRAVESLTKLGVDDVRIGQSPDGTWTAVICFGAPRSKVSRMVWALAPRATHEQAAGAATLLLHVLAQSRDLIRTAYPRCGPDDDATAEAGVVVALTSLWEQRHEEMRRAAVRLDQPTEAPRALPRCPPGAPSWDKAALGQWLDELPRRRRLLGLRQVDVARLAGHPNNGRVSRLENHVRWPSADDMATVSAALGIDPVPIATGATAC